jgi:hypothetical protein
MAEKEILRNRWNVGWIRPTVNPRWNIEAYRDVLLALYSNHVPRKEQPVSKAHKKGHSQSKVA